MNLTPSSAELTQSEELSKVIRNAITQHGGKISFSKYMELALYTPNLGYYSGSASKLGTTGDFITAPEISPLFGVSITQTLLPILENLQKLGKPLEILEFGAGTGKLALSILDELQKLEFEIDSYKILDLSADLIERQKEFLSSRSENIQWLTALPNQFDGIILANEVLDAMPVDIISMIQGKWHYQCVTTNKNGFKFITSDEVPTSLIPNELLHISLPDGFTTELHLNATGWIKSISTMLDTGALLAFDYGFPASEYYHPQRNQGTLMLHYRHHAVQDPFFLPGICDITAHVDWSGIANAAHTHKMNLLGYTNQAAYLLDAGIGELALRDANPNEVDSFLKISNNLQKLLSEAEMGELFKVMCLGKNLGFGEGELPGFRGRPRAL
jgi:SAM-dependent MidA family methyltransferase